MCPCRHRHASSPPPEHLEHLFFAIQGNSSKAKRAGAPQPSLWLLPLPLHRRWLLSDACSPSNTHTHIPTHTSCSSTSWSNATSAVAIARSEVGDKARSRGRGGVTGTGVQPIADPSLSPAPAAGDVDEPEKVMVFFIMKSARRRVWRRKKIEKGHAHTRGAA